MQSILTDHQKKLIKAATGHQLSILVEHHEETSKKSVKHPIFIELLKEYDEVEVDDITFEILNQVITFEELRDNPDMVWEMSAHALLVLQFIILRMLPEYDWPIAKKSLYDKLQKRIDILEICNLN